MILERQVRELADKDPKHPFIEGKEALPWEFMKITQWIGITMAQRRDLQVKKQPGKRRDVAALTFKKQ